VVSPAPRVVGVDLARGLAIIGMFVAHAVPRPDEAELLVDGRSSILFATLAGVSLGIMTGSTSPVSGGRRSDRVVSIVLRALVLFVLGITLSTLGSGIAIILDYYAVMFLLIVPLLFLPRWVLAVLAVIIVIAAPAVSATVPEPTTSTAPLTYILERYLFTGYYPALDWLPLLLAGLIAARSGLTSATTQVAMIVLGALVSVLGYGGAALLPGITAEAHSSTTAEILGSGGLAIAVIGLCLWLTSTERATVGRVIRLVLRPVSAIGAMALTVYTLQILTLAVFAELRDTTVGAVQYPGWPLLIGMTIVSLIFATVWQRYLGRGPFERMLGRLTRAPQGRRAA